MGEPAKSKVGGFRPGAGRPLSDSEPFTGSLPRDLRVRVDRFAASKGVKRRKGFVFWKIVIALLLENVKTPEPEYLRLTKKP